MDYVGTTTPRLSLIQTISHATGFEESGVNDAEGLLAMVHQRYPDVSIGRGGEEWGGGGEGVGKGRKHSM